jgi:hypothetical protein
MANELTRAEARHKYYMENKVRAKEYNDSYYALHRERIIKRQMERISDGSAWFPEYKKTLHCSICGESTPCALDFHHTDPTEKDFNVGYVVRHMNREVTMKEIKKCVVVCKNCHAKIHAGLIGIEDGKTTTI